MRRADGGLAKVLAIERVKLDAPEVVYNFMVKGPHTYFVLEARVLVHNDTAACRFNLATGRFHATESVTINGTQYQKGKFLPNDAVHPPRHLGVSAEMEKAIMENLPEGYIIVLRDRPLGAAELDGIMQYSKKGWIEDWMIYQKHPGGKRELFDANRMRNGEYLDRVTSVEGGYSVKTLDGSTQFISHSELEKYISDGTYDNVTSFKLEGQMTLSDIDVAVYANKDGSIAIDLKDKKGFAVNFNDTYLGGLAPGQYTISHGAQVDIPPYKKEILRKYPGRIEKIEAGQVIVFANLPDIGKVGFQEIIPYKQAEKKYANPWSWYPPGVE